MTQRELEQGEPIKTQQEEQETVTRNKAVAHAGLTNTALTKPLDSNVQLLIPKYSAHEEVNEFLWWKNEYSAVNVAEREREQ